MQPSKGATEQRAIWIRRCPALFTQREVLKDAIRACIGDAEGQEAVLQNKMLELTKGQVQLLAEALRFARDEFEVPDRD